MRIACLLAPGFEEIEAITILDVLRRAELDVRAVAVGGARLVPGAHGISVTADELLAPDQSWDLVVLPGGLPGAENLRDDPGVQTLIQNQAAAGKGLAAICAAPIALAAAGALRGRQATAYPGFEDQLGAEVELRPGDVVRDGPIITSRGPGTALAFALALVETYGAPGQAEALRAGMLVG